MSAQIYTQGIGEQATYNIIQGLGLSFASNTTLTVATGQCRDSQNAFDIFINAPLTINFAVNGANGLDTGTFAANKCYAIYIVADSSNFNAPVAIASLNTTNTPVFPQATQAGGVYNLIKRIGWWTSNGSTHLYATLAQTILYHGTRYYQYNTPVTVGSITTATSLTEQAYLTAPADTLITLTGTYTPATVANTVKLSPVSTSGTGITVCEGIVVSVAHNIGPINLVTTNDATTTTEGAFWIICTSASDALVLNVAGFYDTL